MNDRRWADVAADFEWAAGHFRNAVALHELGEFDAPALEGYRARMGFMHAMLAAHTSLESGLTRILELVGEEKPIGEQWHADLLRRARLAYPGVRPAILDQYLGSAADRTRRFRQVTMRGDDNFDPADAKPAVEAARKLADGLPAALQRFIAALDP